MSDLHPDQDQYKRTERDIYHLEKFRKALEEKGVDLQNIASLLQTARRHLGSGDVHSAGKYAKMAALELKEAANIALINMKERKGGIGEGGP